MTIIKHFRTRDLRGDLYGGLTAAVVALPLALAFGVASGAGPMAGLYGAILVGFFASLFGGTATQISGPTGPMTVVMAAVIVQYAHEPAIAFTIVVLGGVFQILFGVLKLGRLIALVPFTVISGFMSGIGCIIIILQIAPLLGHDVQPGGVLGALRGLPNLVATLNGDAALVGLLAFGIVQLVPPRVSRVLPSPLLALLVGSFLVFWVFDRAPVLGDIPTGIPSLTLPSIEWSVLPDLIGSGLILAFLGSIDSLLTSLIADSMTRTNHQSDRELIGQGIGNIAAGLVGGIPGAGATMRTVVNIRSGGKTRVSGMTHALILLAVVLGLAPLAEHIPQAVLAGILLKVGIDIIDWRYLKHIRYAPRPGVALMLLVLVLTVFVDLILAVSVGMVVASLMLVKRMSEMQLGNATTPPDLDAGIGTPHLNPSEKELLSSHAPEIQYYHFSGPISFAAAKRMVQRITIGDAQRAIILDLSDVPHIDTSAAFAIEDVIERARLAALSVYLVNPRKSVQEVLRGLGILDLLPPTHITHDCGTAVHRAMGREQTREKE